MTNENQATIDIQEAAQILGVCVGTLRRRVKAGIVKPLPKPPLLKQPSKLLFERSEIEKLAPRE